MIKVSLKEVRNKCSEGRFFSYDEWRDKFFVPPSIYLIWVFVRLRLSGNFVSYLSGFVTIIGGAMLASLDDRLVLVGSFSYMVYYLLDYVDGGVSRFNGTSGIGGQYIDWLMHTISSLSIFLGIFIGGYSLVGFWIVPFGVLTLIACVLNLERYSFGWFSICMHYQQQATKTVAIQPIRINDNLSDKILMKRLSFFKHLTNLLFHENYVIFSLPILAIINLCHKEVYLDFRLLFLVLGGVIYFPTIMIDIWFLAKNNRIDQAYNKLFFSSEKPNLPRDHFFNQ